MTGNWLFRKTPVRPRKSRIAATVLLALPLGLSAGSATAQTPRCASAPADEFAYRFVSQLADGIDPQQLYSELSRQTRDSVSSKDVERLQAALRTSHGKPTFFKGPIVENVDPSSLVGSDNQKSDYAQVSFVLESGSGSGLSRLTLLIHCIDQRWFVAGIRLASSN
jgi:hypothetical protein